MEHVVATMSLEVALPGDRGDVQVALVSPQGTHSVLLPYRDEDIFGGQDYLNWPFMSVHYWGEDPAGEWTLTVTYRGFSGSVSLSDLSVTLYGTSETPEVVQRIPANCDADCIRGCAAVGSEFCDACVIYRDAQTLACIDACPDGFEQRSGYCYNGTLPEPTCTGDIGGMCYCDIHSYFCMMT